MVLAGLLLAGAGMAGLQPGASRSNALKLRLPQQVPLVNSDGRESADAPYTRANPDAPHDRHLMRPRIDGRDVALMPLLVASRTQLDRSKAETFFTVLDIRLLEVQPGGYGVPTTAVQRDGAQAWHSPDSSAKEYLARLGGNTSYIFHPEETVPVRLTAKGTTSGGETAGRLYL
jgi:hypothetical protein